MTSRKIIIAAATIIIVVAAWKISQQKAPTTEIADQALFPALIDQLNDARRLSIKSAKNQVELAHSGAGWVVASRDNFPANFASVKSTLLHLSEVLIIDQKTSRPKHYAKIGVQGPDDDGSESLLVKVENGDGVTLASLIIGNKRTANNFGAPNYYVRKSDQATALLAEGELAISDDPLEWMDTAIVSISSERVRSVTISRNEQPAIVVSKEQASDNFFTLQDVPSGFIPTSRAVVSSFGALLLDVKFEDVMAVEKFAGLSPLATAKVLTFDGLIATLEQFSQDGTIGVRFRFEFDPTIVAAEESTNDDVENGNGVPAESDNAASVADEAIALNAKVENWVYVLPDYKNRLIEKQFDDLIKTETETQAADDVEQ